MLFALISSSRFAVGLSSPLPTFHRLFAMSSSPLPVIYSRYTIIPGQGFESLKIVQAPVDQPKQGEVLIAVKVRALPSADDPCGRMLTTRLTGLLAQLPRHSHRQRYVYTHSSKGPHD